MRRPLLRCLERWRKDVVEEEEEVVAVVVVVGRGEGCRDSGVVSGCNRGAEVRLLRCCC